MKVYSYRQNLNELEAVFEDGMSNQRIQKNFRYLWMKTKYCIRIITTPVLPFFFVLSTKIERDWRVVTSRSTAALNFLYSNLYVHRHVAYRNKHVYREKSMKAFVSAVRIRLQRKKNKLFLSFKTVTLPFCLGFITYNT